MVKLLLFDGSIIPIIILWGVIMKYIVKQKIFSLSDKFAIKDEYESDVFIVQSKLFNIGKKLKIFDLNENELCYIEQKLFKFMPEYNIYIDGQIIANIKKKFAFFKNDFNITSSLGNYYAEGNVFAHNFNIFRDGLLVSTISKKLFSFTDTYFVEIDDNQDQVVNLAMVIVIDMVCHDNRNK